VEAPPDEPLSGTHQLTGTPLYMSPEAFGDPGAVDARSDLYALGAVGYFLLAGHHVFEGTLVEVLSHHLRTPPTPLREHGVEVDEELEEILMRCLEKQPDDRWASADDLAAALHACPDAGRWTREHARAFWAEHGSTLAAGRAEKREPAQLSLAPAGSG
jgi:serine/threonine-protein kinase